MWPLIILGIPLQVSNSLDPNQAVYRRYQQTSWQQFGPFPTKLLKI